jgi:hypothetical protein
VDGHGEINLGDANTQSIEEIWNSAELNRLREGFLNHRAMHPRCQRCEIADRIHAFFPPADVAEPA